MRRITAALLVCAIAFAALAEPPQKTFVFVKIQDTVEPVVRGSKYEDPLDDALRTAGLGEVTGGGTMLNKDNSIAWVGVDVDLYDVKKGIPFLITKLRELGAPPGSLLEYTRMGKKVEVPVR